MVADSNELAEGGGVMQQMLPARKNLMAAWVLIFVGKGKSCAVLCSFHLFLGFTSAMREQSIR